MKNFLVEKVRVVDVSIVLLVIVALFVGFFTFKHFRQTASKQVDSTSNIVFQVFLRGVTITQKNNPIKTGDKTFISIRNVPYTDLDIADVKIDTKKVVVPNPKGNPTFLLVDDYSQVFMYDIVVSVTDKAQITKDGAVVGGNKIKIGLPITLEGKDYKFNGTVSSVQILPKGMTYDDVKKAALQRQNAGKMGAQGLTPSSILKQQPKVSPVAKPVQK